MYLREDTFFWSADLIYVNGEREHSLDSFDSLLLEEQCRENIPLAFDYGTASLLDTDRFSEVVDDVLIY